MNRKFSVIIASLFVLLLIDQIVKIYIKTHFSLGEEISYIGNWAKIHFTENPGFALGLSFGGNVGKIVLTLIRMVASVFLVYYLFKLSKQKVSNGVIVGITLVTAGAIGNLIDCVFYGVLFGESTYHTVATFLPQSGGYAPWLLGRVVDMFYFPVIQTTYPNWLPFVGGQELIFFRFIFNIADASITIGVIYLLLFQRRFFIKKS